MVEKVFDGTQYVHYVEKYFNSLCEFEMYFFRPLLTYTIQQN